MTASSLNFPCASAWSTSAGEGQPPTGARSTVTSPPCRSRIAAIRSLKKPELTTSARSPGSIRFAAAISIARVPEPATMNGCALCERHTCRKRPSARAKISMNAGSTWLRVLPPRAASTSGSNSTGPGIINRSRWLGIGVLLSDPA